MGSQLARVAHFARCSRAEWAAEAEFLTIRELCLHFGVGATLHKWVSQARHLGRADFAERLVLLLRVP